MNILYISNKVITINIKSKYIKKSHITTNNFEFTKLNSITSGAYKIDLSRQMTNFDFF